MTKKHVLALVVAGIVAMALGIVAGHAVKRYLAKEDAAERQEAAALSRPETLPAFTLYDMSGEAVTKQELLANDKALFINFWATWCKPCREEIPALEALHQRHSADGLLIAGVSIDQPGDSAKIVSFASALGATYSLWHDPDDKVSTTFLAIGVPASYLIGRDGTLRWRHVGPVKADDGPLNEALRIALAEPASSTP